MPRLRPFAVLLVLCAAGLPCAVSLAAQQNQHDALTKEEIEKIKDLGTEPNRRIGYFVDILNDRADDLRALAKRAPTPARDARFDSGLQNFSSILDELGDNLDEFGDRDADLRGALKTLNDDCPKWLTLLNSLPASPAYDISRQAALESLQDLADQAKALLTQQDAYFKAHPKEKGQQRAEPN